MRTSLFAFVLGCAVAAGGGYLLLREGSRQAVDRIAELEREVTTKSESLLGYTRYTDYLTAGKKRLGERSSFLAARVVREEGVTRKIEKTWFGLRSRGVVSVDYTAEYAFGYDLRSGSYDLVDTPTGLEIRLQRPALVAAPAVSKLRHEVLSGGVLTDEDAAVRELYEEASERASKQGVAMAQDDAIVALREKSLVAFLRDFLAKQPGVARVPAIAVAYRESPG